ncbi:uncharacterized protein PRCAT00004751001 [Priceomyces carsonii]|uniref:uncharacterized protein n=1 Tax=Priceomyces carsonii TaxID=28549 RepID=UPI002ED8A7EA|nr:unnamed protein product [Priceomyces carsonii]
MTYDIEKAYGVTEIGELTYKGNSALSKPSQASRGVYGGSIAAQAVLVAIKSSPDGFRPHSLHSSFVKPVSPKEPIIWKVQIISNGKNFCNRTITGTQGNEIKYYANVSLTRKNSLKRATMEYENYKAKLERGDDDDDDDDEGVVQKPFGFQSPYHKWFTPDSVNKLKEIPLVFNQLKVYHKFSPKFVDLDATKEEESIPPAERSLSFYTKFGEEGEISYDDDAYNYVGLAVLSDTVFLASLGRALRLRHIDLRHGIHYFSVSLDHTIYFHDEDFDPRKWMMFSFRYPRLSNDRLLVEGEMYNDKGVQVATVIQEGLVKLNGLEQGAKL